MIIWELSFMAPEASTAPFIWRGPTREMGPEEEIGPVWGILFSVSELWIERPRQGGLLRVFGSRRCWLPRIALWERVARRATEIVRAIGDVGRREYILRFFG